MAASLALVTTEARADGPSQKACTDSYTRAQSLKLDAKLSAAREQLLICSTDVCPQVFRADCAGWLKEVDSAVPTVVLKVTGKGGEPVSDYRALVDGVAIDPAQLKGSIPMDPGTHTIKVECPDCAAAPVEITLARGEKDHVAEVHVATGGRRGLPLPSVIVGGVGLAGLASFVIAGAIGVSARSRLDPCKPNCALDDIAAVRRDFVVADVSLGVGILGLGLATALYFARPQKSPSASAAPRFAFTVRRGAMGISSEVAF